jgi:hypothetical protein
MLSAIPLLEKEGVRGRLSGDLDFVPTTPQPPPRLRRGVIFIASLTTAYKLLVSNLGRGKRV